MCMRVYIDLQIVIVINVNVSSVRSIVKPYTLWSFCLGHSIPFYILFKKRAELFTILKLTFFFIPERNRIFLSIIVRYLRPNLLDVKYICPMSKNFNNL